jgi:hypothetical protein
MTSTEGNTSGGKYCHSKDRLRLTDTQRLPPNQRRVSATAIPIFIHFAPRLTNNVVKRIMHASPSGYKNNGINFERKRIMISITWDEFLPVGFSPSNWRVFFVCLENRQLFSFPG